MKSRNVSSADLRLANALQGSFLICLLSATLGSAAHAQDAAYPYAPMNPYIPIAPPDAPTQGAGSSVPWPYNPLGTPAAPLPNQTLPNSQVPTPTISPPNNLNTPNPMPRDGAINPFGQSTAPGYTPEPPVQPVSATPSSAPPSAMTQPGSITDGKLPDEKKSDEPGPDDKKTKDPGKDSEGKKKDEAKKDDENGKGDDKDKQAEEKDKKQQFGVAIYSPIREALFQLNTKQYPKALETLNKVLSNNPNHPQARYVRAVVFVNLRQYPDAMKDYKEVLRLTPNSDLGRRAAEGLKNISFLP